MQIARSMSFAHSRWVVESLLPQNKICKHEIRRNPSFIWTSRLLLQRISICAVSWKSHAQKTLRYTLTYHYFQSAIFWQEMGKTVLARCDSLMCTCLFVWLASYFQVQVQQNLAQWSTSWWHEIICAISSFIWKNFPHLFFTRSLLKFSFFNYLIKSIYSHISLGLQLFLCDLQVIAVALLLSYVLGS